MPIYRYRARDNKSQIKSGLVEAPNELEATELLREQGLTPFSLKLESSGQIEAPLLVGRISPKDLVVFTRQFSVLISANVTIVEALRILVEQTENLKLKMEISKIYDEVDGGVKLSDALAKRPKLFGPFYVNVVRAGEASGKLDEVLNYLADQMEKDYDMRSKVKGAMIYPAFVLSAMIGLGIFMMIKVIPQLLASLLEANIPLPIQTKILVATSNFLIKYWLIVILAIVGSVVGFKFITSRGIGKKVWDNIKLKLPVFGRLFRMIYIVRFTSTMHTLIKGGVSLTKSLRITAEVIDNYVFQELIQKTIKEVEEGNSVALVFSASPFIPKMVSQMMSIGEKTGRLDLVFERISIFYSRDIDNMVANMSSIMEPVIMVIIGIGVFIMVGAVMIPMFQIASAQ